MSNIIPFQFEKFPVRVVTDDNGDPLFVAADIAKALDYRDAPDMTRNLDDDEKGTQIVRTLGGDQEMTVINESGVYSAIMKSRKPEAKKFKKWVTSEVLPSIRKTGAYAMPGVEFSLPAPMMSAITQTVAALFDVYHSRMLQSAKAIQETSVIHGMTAGQIWDLHGLPKLKGAAAWLSRQLTKQECQIEGGGRAMLGGRSAKLFNPEKAASRMKAGMLLLCRQYISDRTGSGQSNLFKLK